MELLARLLGDRKVDGVVKEFYRVSTAGIPAFVMDYERGFDDLEALGIFVDSSDGKSVLSASRGKDGKVICDYFEDVRYLFERGDGFSLSKESVISREARSLVEESFENVRGKVGCVGF